MLCEGWLMLLTLPGWPSVAPGSAAGQYNPLL